MRASIAPDAARTGRRLDASSAIPQATYRFQFHRDFTLRHAEALVPYLASLGVTHCYASPLLTARPGSMHGYDIVDHHRLNPEIGSPSDFDAFCDCLRRHAMRLIVDIVPNHMGVGSDNHWWMDVLAHGEASDYAAYFDIDWRPLKPELKRKILLPVLGAPYGQVLESGELTLRFSPESGGFHLRYYEHVWPIATHAWADMLKEGLPTLSDRLGRTPLLAEYRALIQFIETECQPGSRDARYVAESLQSLCARCDELAAVMEDGLAGFCEPGRLHQLLEKQFYRLAYWRVASDEINYRRFFDVNTLAGLNMQHRAVFEDTHRLLLDWLRAGKVSGFRIDHPDGLYHPAAYFQALQDAARQAGLPAVNARGDVLPLWVEKILAPHESLPDDWPVLGTSGYEFGNRVTGLLIRQASEARFNEIYSQFSGNHAPVDEQVYACKHLILKAVLSSELSVLANRLYQISEQDWKTRDFTLNSLRRALAEVITVFPVYRTYISAGDVHKKDCDYVQWAVQLAKKRNTLLDSSIFDFIRRLLLQEFDAPVSESYRWQALDFAMRFQQLSGPVMAKGLEDTAFYRYNRLLAMNEVGGELGHFGLSINAFHYQMQEQQRTFPHTMLATSTHDSKRSEDVRARLCVLSEMPDLWERMLERWSRLNRQKKSVTGMSETELAPDRNDEYLIYQTLLGAWPMAGLNDDNRQAFEARVTGYLIKACREAKLNTSWLNPDADYESAVTRFVGELLSTEGSNAFLEDFLPLQKTLSDFGAVNALAQVLLKLTVPGFADLYQGSETWCLNLVDPDNRRPVDYDALARLMQATQEGLDTVDAWSGALRRYQDGRVKLGLISRVLQCRREHPDVWTHGEYLPLPVEGPGAEHLVAFARRHASETMVVLAPRLLYTLLSERDDLPESAELPDLSLLEHLEDVWAGTRVDLSPLVDDTPGAVENRLLRDVLTGRNWPLAGGACVPGGSFARWPFALCRLMDKERNRDDD